MTTFLRAGIRPDRWLAHPELEWLDPGVASADAIDDLRTKQHSLSLFEVGDDPAEHERVAVAIAAGKDKPDLAGYALFDRRDFEALGVLLRQKGGETADPGINPQHYDVYQLSAPQLAALACVVVRGTIRSILPKRVTVLIKDGLGAGRLDRAKVNPKLLARTTLNAVTCPPPSSVPVHG